MECGGNKAFKDFLVKHAITDLSSDAKYTTRAAQLYRQKLKVLANSSKGAAKKSVATPFGNVDTSMLIDTASPEPEQKQEKPKVEQPAMKPLMSQTKVFL